jgi:hypothetical protein
VEIFSTLVDCLNDSFVGGRLTKDGLFLGLQAIAKMQDNGRMQCALSLKGASKSCVYVDGVLLGGNLDLQDRLYGIGALQTLHSIGFFNDVNDVRLRERWRAAGEDCWDHFTEDPDCSFGIDWNFDTYIHFLVDPGFINEMKMMTQSDAMVVWDFSENLEIKTR